MNHEQFIAYLKSKNACEDAMEWLSEKKYSLSETWDNCERGDWMLWLAYESETIDLRTLTLAKVECAELFMHLMKDHRSHKAMIVARRFAEGRATLKELSTIVTKDSTAEPTYATLAAYTAAYAGSYSINNFSQTDCILNSQENLKKYAGIVRKIIPIFQLKKAIT